jgi:hypothetical protein
MIRKFTEEQVATALRKSAGLQSAAAKILGCAESTLHNYMETFPGLRDVQREIIDQHLDMAEGKLLGAIKNGNMTAIIFYLKCKGKHRGYVDRAVVDVRGSLSIGPDLSGASIEDLERIATGNEED